MVQERTNRPKSAGASRRFFAPLRARRAEARRTRPTLRRPLPPRSAGRFPSRGARALRVSLRAGPAPRFARFPPPAFSPFLPRPPATRRALLPFLPSLPGGRAARFLPIFIPIPCGTTLRFPQRAAARFSPFLSPSHRDAKNFHPHSTRREIIFWESTKWMKLFGRFACLYIGGPVTGMHGRPAASGGRPLPQQGGAAVTGLRAVWGARTPAPAEETAAHAVKQTARYPRAKPKERIRQK